MPRMDVPPPGQGKRSQRKAWRDNANQAIAIYSLTAAETPEEKAIEEDLEAMSQALPYWDEEQQPHSQSQSHSHSYTVEEAQELVERAYQEGWQQGLEEGYKLGKDKGYKEQKAQELEEEEEARKAKNEANVAVTTYQDTRNTPSIVTMVNADENGAPLDVESRDFVYSRANLYGITERESTQDVRTVVYRSSTTILCRFTKHPHGITGSLRDAPGTQQGIAEVSPHCYF